MARLFECQLPKWPLKPAKAVIVTGRRVSAHRILTTNGIDS